MPTIRIDDEVWEALQKNAKPFVDTPNSVLRELLKLDGGRKPEREPRAVGRTPNSAYRRPILQALVEMGGKGRTNKVVERVGELMKSTLKRVDNDKVSSGEVRWRNAARFERLTMTKEGLLKPDSPNGYWEITEKGRKYLQ